MSPQAAATKKQKQKQKQKRRKPTTATATATKKSTKPKATAKVLSDAERGRVLDALLKHDFEQLAPKGSLPKRYAFVGKGDIYMTRHCRDLTAKSGKVLYIVYSPRSLERLGLGCPEHVVKEVEAMAAATCQVRQQAVLAKDRKDEALARELITTVFPGIPTEAADAVLRHGFAKGSGRVGRSTVLEGEDKVHLAVVAHARHTMTPYDQLLRELERTGGRTAAAREKAREAIKEQLEEVLRIWKRRISSTVISPADAKAMTRTAIQHNLIRPTYLKKKTPDSTRVQKASRVLKRSLSPLSLETESNQKRVKQVTLTENTRGPRRKAALVAERRISISSPSRSKSYSLV